MRKGIILKGVTHHNVTTVFWAHIFHFFVSFKLHVTLYYWFLIEMFFSCSLLKKHPYSVDFKGVNCRRFLFQHYLFRTFSSGVAWSSAFWALSYCPRATGRLLKLQLACCRTSCSSSEETKMLRQANFIWSFVNYQLMMCHFLVLTEFWLYSYFACTCANTLSSPPQNNLIGIYSIIEM